ncbi:MAG: hypothetical protein AB2693_29705 [Candidatus Thiodiazotropha sp.]
MIKAVAHQICHCLCNTQTATSGTQLSLVVSQYSFEQLDSGLQRDVIVHEVHKINYRKSSHDAIKLNPANQRHHFGEKEKEVATLKNIN